MTARAAAAVPRAPLGAVLATVLLVQVVMNASRPMVSYRALALGADGFTLGLISASFAVLPVIAAIPIGNTMVRRGARPFVVGACLLSTAGCLALALADSLAGIVLLQSLLGLALVSAAIAFQTLVANAGPDATSESRFGAFSAVVSLGQLLGPATAGAVATAASAAGWRSPDDVHATTAVFVVLTACSAVAVGPALAIRERRRADRPPARVAPAEVLGTLRAPGMAHAMVASLVVLSVVDILSVYLPAWGEERGWSVAFVSMLLAVRAAGSFAVRLLLQPLVERLGRRWPLAVGCAVAATALAVLPLLDASALLVTAMAVVGLVLGMGQPMTMSWVSRVVPVRLRSTALAIRLAGNRVGQFAIPIGVGAVTGFAGTAAIFVALAGLLLLTTGLVAVSRIDAPGVPPGDAAAPGEPGR